MTPRYALHDPAWVCLDCAYTSHSDYWVATHEEETGHFMVEEDAT